MSIVYHLHTRLRLRFEGFTLAEVLIALLILAEIATFTIPKIINAQTNGMNNAITKEAASAVAAAYQIYRLQNTGSSSNTGISDLTPYLNYTAVDTTTVIDDKQTLGTQQCSTAIDAKCLKLHSGAIIRYGLSSSGYNLGGTATNSAIWFDVDPDGKVTDGTTNGPGKAVEFWLYYSGRVSSYGTIVSNTCTNGGCINPAPSYDPSWFAW